MYKVSSFSSKYPSQEVTRVRPKSEGSWREIFQGDGRDNICFVLNELRGYIDFWRKV